jgi:hypothetical protein
MASRIIAHLHAEDMQPEDTQPFAASTVQEKISSRWLFDHEIDVFSFPLHTQRLCVCAADRGKDRPAGHKLSTPVVNAGCPDNNSRCSIVVSTARCGFTVDPSRPMFDSWHRQFPQSVLFFFFFRFLPESFPFLYSAYIGTHNR